MTIAPRKKPTQQRAKETVDRILSATAVLLDEVGIDGTTTNLIAERSGVTVGSMYQYFPNKYAILAAVAERMFTEQNERLEVFLGPEGFTLPWAEAVDAMIDASYAGRRSQPGSVAIRRAVAAVPELALVRERDREALTKRIVTTFRASGAGLPDAQLEAVAHTVIDVVIAVMDQAMVADAAQAARLIAELKLLLRSYLANYLR